MNNQMPPDEWLWALNEEYRAKDIHPRQRPWLALMEWLRVTGKPTNLREPAVMSLFSWFAGNSKPGSQALGPIFTGAFHFDCSIWPVVMPVILGRVTLDSGSSLLGMPDSIKQNLFRNRVAVSKYDSIWRDCATFAYGLMRLIVAVQSNCYALRLIGAADQQLCAAADLLCVTTPNQKSIESSRMVVEMFLKAFLTITDSLDEPRAKREYGHDLQKLATRCASVQPSSIFDQVIHSVGLFPTVNDRYQPHSFTSNKLAEGYYLAQALSAHVVTVLSGYAIKPIQ